MGNLFLGVWLKPFPLTFLRCKACQYIEPISLSAVFVSFETKYTLSQALELIGINQLGRLNETISLMD